MMYFPEGVGRARIPFDERLADLQALSFKYGQECEEVIEEEVEINKVKPVLTEAELLLQDVSDLTTCALHKV